MTGLRITVVEPDGAGGLIHYAYQLCDALAAEGHDVTLITGRHYELASLPHRFHVEPLIDLWPAVAPARTPPRGLPQALLRVGRKVRRAARALRYVVAWERLTRHLLRHRPEVVLFSVVRFPIQALWLRRLHRRGVALAQVCHEFERRESRLPFLGSLVARLDRAAYPCFSAIFLHGEANRQVFHGIFDIARDRTHAIPHGDESLFVGRADAGGDLRRRYGIPPGRPVALFFGGMRPSKGIPDLVDAFAAARDEVEASLLIAGAPAGVDPGAVETRAARHGIEEDVVVDPSYLPISAVGPLVRTATVVVLPYRSATASGVLQIAYAFERPVIVTDVGALPEAVGDGETGLVVPAGDVAALSRALAKILGDPDDAARMGAEGKRLAERSYGWPQIAERVGDVCREISGGGP